MRAFAKWCAFSEDAEQLGPGDYQPTNLPWIVPAPPFEALPQEKSPLQSQVSVQVTEQPRKVLGNHSNEGLRRSTRGWQPSTAALKNIAAREEIAAQVEDLLKADGDTVLSTNASEFFQSDVAHATQDLDVPRTYAQILRLPADEKEKWLQACQRESASHLSIPSISESCARINGPSRRQLD